MIKHRKLPLRVCIGCQEKKTKKELVRIVRTPSGDVVLDLTGKKPGRGAYICPLQTCLNQAIKGKQLEKNLQMPVSNELIAAIAAILDQKPEGEGELWGGLTIWRCTK
ncbi:MAG: YlxR family protein [Clostridia bacterium]|nr:YlxR family protein [Clostridia bacterium]